MDKEMTLNEAIVMSVDDRSGGLTFTELMSDISTLFYLKKLNLKVCPTPDEVEKAVRENPDLRVLEYHTSIQLNSNDMGED
jgi:di/tripeptidase